MASLVARSVALPGLAQKGKAARVSSRRPVPFAPARRVFARAAAPEAAAEEAEPAGWNVELQDILDEIVFDGENDPTAELEEEDYDLIAEVEGAAASILEIPTDVAASLVAEGEGESAEDVSQATAVSEALFFDRLLNGAEEAVTEADLEDLEAFGADAPVEEVMDVLAPSNGNKFLDPPLTPLERAEVASLKLSKSELRNLVPKDWDQINIDFFSNKKEENIPLPEFKLNVLWTAQNVAVAVDQVYSRGQVSPLTEYFFWPRNDAWEEMKGALETRPWINERDKIILLNRLTQIINFWQDEAVKHTVEEARVEFPDCTFMSG